VENTPAKEPVDLSQLVLAPGAKMGGIFGIIHGFGGNLVLE
jgi:hypothetical protein